MNCFIDNLLRMRLLSEAYSLWETQASFPIIPATRNFVHSIISHTLPSDPKRFQRGNLETLRTREGLLTDLKEKENLLYEGTSWAVATTIGPYGNHHLMVIYSGTSTEVSHMWQLQEDEKEEYFEIIARLHQAFNQSFQREIINGEVEVLFWMNHSFVPWPWKSQSVFRPHTHLVAIHLNEKDDGAHSIKKILFVPQGSESNKSMLALNTQNLLMIQDFERVIFNDLHPAPALLIAPNEYYALDFELTWEISDSKTIEMLTKIHTFGRKFLEHLFHQSELWISKATRESISWNEDKIGFSICFHKSEGKNYIRFRFSYKNDWEQAWVLESMLHSINRNTDAPDQLPDTSRIKKLVSEVFQA